MNGFGDKMAKAIHSMIRVLDEARSGAFYDAAFGLKVTDRAGFRHLDADLPL